MPCRQREMISLLSSSLAGTPFRPGIRLPFPGPAAVASPVPPLVCSGGQRFSSVDIKNFAHRCSKPSRSRCWLLIDCGGGRGSEARPSVSASLSLSSVPGEPPSAARRSIAAPSSSARSRGRRCLTAARIGRHTHRSRLNTPSTSDLTHGNDATSSDPPTAATADASVGASAFGTSMLPSKKTSTSACAGTTTVEPASASAHRRVSAAAVSSWLILPSSCPWSSSFCMAVSRHLR